MLARMRPMGRCEIIVELMQFARDAQQGMQM